MSTTLSFDIYMGVEQEKAIDFIINATKDNQSVEKIKDREAYNYQDKDTFGLLYKPFGIIAQATNKEREYFIRFEYDIKTDYSWIFEIHRNNPEYRKEVFKFISIIMKAFPGDCILSGDGGVPVMLRKNGKIIIDHVSGIENSKWPPEYLDMPFEYAVIENPDDEDDEDLYLAGLELLRLEVVPTVEELMKYLKE